MLESAIVSKILRYLKGLPSCFVWKTHGSMYGQSGIPDIIACVNGRFVAFEVKTDTGRMTALQAATLLKIAEAGGCAYMVRSVGEVEDIIRGLEGLPHGKCHADDREGVSVPNA